MIITISGKPGSGKNTVADLLAEELKLKRYSVGNYRREMAKQRGITIHELNQLGEKEAFTDNEADCWQIAIGKNEDNFIIDGRLSYYFIPNSIKFYLDVSSEAGAKRIMLNKRSEEISDSLENAVNQWHERIKSDSIRYEKYYNLNPHDLKNYDFVVDSSNFSSGEVLNQLLSYLKSKK